MFAGLFKISLLLAGPLATLANPHGALHHNRHVEIAKRQGADVQLFKRFSSARWTFYDVGLGACGEYNVASDFIVALNSNQYGGGYPGPNCFKKITMTYNGKTTTATIMDECPGCPYGGLDLSRGLFKFFAPESEGVIYGTWNFAGEGGDDDDEPTTSKYVAPKTTSTKKHTTTSTWKPEPTTTWTPEPTTSTSTKKSTSTSHTTSSTSTSHSSNLSSKASSSTSHSTTPSVTPSATPSSTTNNLNLAALDQGFLQLGVLVVAAA